MSAVILDTETTGIGEEDKVIEFACTSIIPHLTLADIDDVSIADARFSSDRAISFGAMATHHIIDADLAGLRPFPGFDESRGIAYIIAHNVDYDWAAIGSPNVKRICTLAFARSFWPELDSHSLGAMTYHFTERHEARDLLRGAHGAARDVELCCRILVQVLRRLPHVTSWEQLWQASENARVPLRLSFGKYGPYEDWSKKTGEPGMLCAQVRSYDPGYWNWLMSKCDQVQDDPYLRKALGGPL